MYKLLFLATAAYLTSIYSYQITDIDNNTINLSDYQGKKILLVNIATGSPLVSQLGELQQLSQQYGDSVVIIAFPSNNFGHETRSNSEIKQFCQSQYGTTFRLAAKGAVRGSDIQPLYNWLARQSENGILSNDVVEDFQKFLVDRNGLLIGIFSSTVVLPIVQYKMRSQIIKIVTDMISGKKINRIVAVLPFLFLGILIRGQQPLPSPYTGTTKINYVRTWDAVKPETDPNNFHTGTEPTVGKMVTQYIDGLGRLIQTVEKKGSMVTGGSAADMVAPVVYDAFGMNSVPVFALCSQ